MVKQSRYLEVRLDGASLYRSERRVLTRIDWTIRPAERWVLLGANGSGKTQLLKLIAGIVRLPPASPPTLRYRLGGEWHRVPYEVKERIAYVGPERQDKYQRYEWNMSAGDVVGTGGAQQRHPTHRSEPGRASTRASHTWNAPHRTPRRPPLS
jgi:ABC-type molybdenum transport system ATPase subunit/photorepair protein PhrA